MSDTEECLREPTQHFLEEAAPGKSESVIESLETFEKHLENDDGSVKSGTSSSHTTTNDDTTTDDQDSLCSEELEEQTSNNSHTPEHGTSNSTELGVSEHTTFPPSTACTAAISVPEMVVQKTASNGETLQITESPCPQLKSGT